MSSPPKAGEVPILPTPPPEMSSLQPNGPNAVMYYRMLHNYGNKLVALGETQYAFQLPSDRRSRATFLRRAHHFAKGRKSRAKKRRKVEPQSSKPSSSLAKDKPKDKVTSADSTPALSVVSNEENEDVFGQFEDAKEEEPNDDVDIFLHFVTNARKCY